MSGLCAFWIGVAGAIGIAIAARQFYQQQNQGRIGGAISLPKAYWLGLVIYCWYVLGTLLVFLRPPLILHTTLVVTSVSVWLRGLIELAMLFHYKNWLPKYGIAHNFSTLALLTIGTAWTLGQGSSPGVLDWVAISMWIMNMGMELYHAVAFSKIVGEKTTGDHAVWFANANAPEFRAINRITTRNNVILTLTALLALGLMATQSSDTQKTSPLRSPVPPEQPR